MNTAIANNSQSIFIHNSLLSFKNYIEFEFGKLPVLEVDGVQLNQSFVIAAYVANMHGIQTLIKPYSLVKYSASLVLELATIFNERY